MEIIIRFNRFWIVSILKGGPTHLIDPIASKLGAAKYDENIRDYVVDCDDKTLGNVEFTFGKFKVVLTPGDYLQLDSSGVSILHWWMLNDV